MLQWCWEYLRSWVCPLTPLVGHLNFCALETTTVPFFVSLDLLASVCVLSVLLLPAYCFTNRTGPLLHNTPSWPCSGVSVTATLLLLRLRAVVPQTNASLEVQQRIFHLKWYNRKKKNKSFCFYDRKIIPTYQFFLTFPSSYTEPYYIWIDLTKIKYFYFYWINHSSFSMTVFMSQCRHCWRKSLDLLMWSLMKWS